MATNIDLTYRIRINKDNGTARFAVIYDGKERLLAYRAARILARLALSRLTTDHGWLTREEVDPFHHQQYISRLRIAIGDHNVIDSRFGGGYRLALSPSQITVHPEAMDILDDETITEAFMQLGGADGHQNM